MALRRVVLGVLAPAALFLCVAAAATPRPPITQAQSGKTFRIAKGGSATLRLSSRWVWAEPRVSSRAVELTPVFYLVDPGYSEWQVSGRAYATAMIRSLGKPACTGCGLSARGFRVTIVVR